ALCLVIGYPFAYVMARRAGWVSTLLLTVIAMSFWTGFLVRTYAWLVILGSKGPVAAAYGALGLGKAPQLLFSTFSSTLGMTHILLPYMILALYASMRQIEELLAFGFASAVAVVLLVATCVVLAIYNHYAGLDRLWG